MAITVEATYEDGVLKPKQPLPFEEHETVRVTVASDAGEARKPQGIIACSDPALIEQAALDPELEYQQ